LNKNSPERVVIPKSLQLITLRFLHEGMAHIGKHRMMACISTRYWWIGMTSDVQSYNNNCRRCSLRKASNYGKNSIPLQRYPVACSPFEWVHADLIVELPKTSEGYRHILVIKERLTQWIELIPLRTKTALEVAEALFTHLYCRHGAVKHIVSDQGKEFVNRINEAVNHLLQQQAIFTTPYNPNANGFAENQNRTVKDMLSSYVNE